MIRIARHKIRHIIYSVLGSIALSVGMYSCANIGRPDGGAYDELPPKFVKSIPLQGALNNTKKKIVIEFDEFIKLEKASEKVVVSPPQIQAPEIKPSGKKVTVSLQDTLKPNATYTIDFSDAIVDNNEDNPLGNFTFSFSTGGVIDTMEVAGVLLDASNLEPVKGMLMGLHSNLSDSAFIKLPLDRVSRTDSRGKFSIRGVAPGSYRLYGLMDANQNFEFDQKSEAIAFNDSLIIPSLEERVRQDTIWKDTLTIDTIVEKRFTYYLPDHVVMRSFVEDATMQYFVKSERPKPQKFSFYFSAPADTLPTIRGFNFDAKDAFLIEKSLKNDTIHYWIKDSLLYKTDTLNMEVDYLYTDTLGMLVPKTDTLLLASKMIKAPIKAKKKKKSEEPEPTVFLKATVDAPSLMDLYRNVSLEFEEPIAYFDSSAIHLEIK
ncbi:MAG: Ig-like domain-containing domain, partial [Bacteroides sp.]